MWSWTSSQLPKIAEVKRNLLDTWHGDTRWCSPSLLLSQTLPCWSLDMIQFWINCCKSFSNSIENIRISNIYLSSSSILTYTPLHAQAKKHHLEGTNTQSSPSPEHNKLHQKDWCRHRPRSRWSPTCLPTRWRLWRSMTRKTKAFLCQILNIKTDFWLFEVGLRTFVHIVRFYQCTWYYLIRVLHCQFHLLDCCFHMSNPLTSNYQSIPH